tara:strand:+ start:1237 stop:2856 length:1620 start_codon:yes stop_codon:yes gene_type:complete
MTLATTVCIIGTKQLKPAPLLSIQSEFTRGGPNNSIIGAVWSVTLNGTIIPTGEDGESLSEGYGGVLGVFKEKDEIFKAFSQDGSTFIAQLSGSCSGSIISGTPFVRSLSMDDSTDNFSQTATYTVELCFPKTAGRSPFDDILSGAYSLESASTTFSESYEKLPFTYAGEGQPGVQTLTRTTTATALKDAVTYELDGAVLAAAAYVAGVTAEAGCPENASGVGFGTLVDSSKPGSPYNPQPSTGPGGSKDYLAPPDLLPTGGDVFCFQTNRSLDWDTTAGSFTQVDTFTKISTGLGFNSNGFKVRDEYSWDTSFDWSAGGQNTLTINGTVQGYAGFDPTGMLSGVHTSAIAQAEGYYQISQPSRLAHIKAQASGISSNKANGIHPESDYRLQGNNFSLNVAEGTLTYSETYITDAPFNTGALSESVNVTRANPSQVFAEQVVIGRAAGPILQDIGTNTATTEELSIEAVVIPPSASLSEMESNGGLRGAPNYNDLVNSHLSSISGSNVSIFKTSDSESFDLKTGRYTRNVGYIYTDCPS